MTDEDRDRRMGEFLQVQVTRRRDPLCRACHEQPKVSSTGLCASCEAKAWARHVFTPTPEPEV